MRKITAVFLSLMMAFTSLNVFVYAEGDTDEPAIEETETVTEEETEIEPEDMTTCISFSHRICFFGAWKRPGYLI